MRHGKYIDKNLTEVNSKKHLGKRHHHSGIIGERHLSSGQHKLHRHGMHTDVEKLNETLDYIMKIRSVT